MIWLWTPKPHPAPCDAMWSREKRMALELKSQLKSYFQKHPWGRYVSSNLRGWINKHAHLLSDYSKLSPVLRVACIISSNPRDYLFFLQRFCALFLYYLRIPYMHIVCFHPIQRPFPSFQFLPRESWSSKKLFSVDSCWGKEVSILQGYAPTKATPAPVEEVAPTSMHVQAIVWFLKNKNKKLMISYAFILRPPWSVTSKNKSTPPMVRI